MARARKKAGGDRGATRSRSRKAAPAPAPAVEVVEEVKGLGMEDGIIILTTVILAAALMLVDYAKGAFYDRGFLF